MPPGGACIMGCCGNPDPTFPCSVAFNQSLGPGESVAVLGVRVPECPESSFVIIETRPVNVNSKPFGTEFLHYDGGGGGLWRYSKRVIPGGSGYSYNRRVEIDLGVGNFPAGFTGGTEPHLVVMRMKVTDTVSGRYVEATRTTAPEVYPGTMSVQTNAPNPNCGVFTGVAPVAISWGAGRASWVRHENQLIGSTASVTFSGIMNCTNKDNSAVAPRVEGRLSPLCPTSPTDLNGCTPIAFPDDCDELVSECMKTLCEEGTGDPNEWKIYNTADMWLESIDEMNTTHSASISSYSKLTGDGWCASATWGSPTVLTQCIAGSNPSRQASGVLLGCGGLFTGAAVPNGTADVAAHRSGACAQMMAQNQTTFTKACQCCAVWNPWGGVLSLTYVLGGPYTSMYLRDPAASYFARVKWNSSACQSYVSAFAPEGWTRNVLPCRVGVINDGVEFSPYPAGGDEWDSFWLSRFQFP